MISRKRKKNPLIRILLCLLTLILVWGVYAIIAILISYKEQPEVGEAEKDNFSLSDYLTASEEIERAGVIEDNEEALLVRLRMIEEAESEIILSTFDFKSDDSGRQILAALLSAAERGVKIRILVDGFSGLLDMRHDAYFSCLYERPEVEIRLYNIPKIWRMDQSMGRMHDKYLIVDDKYYILGGRNTYNYFLGDYGYKNYDRDILVVKENPKDRQTSMEELKKYFASVWEVEECTDYGVISVDSSKLLEKAREELRNINENMVQEDTRLSENALWLYERCVPVEKISLITNPVHVSAKEPTAFYELFRLMREADGTVMIHSPYIIANEYMESEFRALCEAKPDSAIMTNSALNNGNPFGAADYERNKDHILSDGFTIYEYQGGVSYHGKSITIGDEISIVGSFNMDMRSAYLDTEIMMVVKSREINEELRTNMERYENQCFVYAADGSLIQEGETMEVKLSVKKKILRKMADLLRAFRFLM